MRKLASALRHHWRERPRDPSCARCQRIVARGGFLTQAAILKITANGTTTSPVRARSFCHGRACSEGRPSRRHRTSLPSNRTCSGATTIREQLDKHRNDAIMRLMPCEDRSARLRPGILRCHRRLQRERYRSIDERRSGAARQHRSAHRHQFQAWPQGRCQRPAARRTRSSATSSAFQESARRRHPHSCCTTSPSQLTIYATGRDITFSDRAALNDIVARTEKQGGGIRTLLHEIALSSLFQTR